MLRFFQHLILVTLFIFIAHHAFGADQFNSPPRCLGDACLGDHIEKYKNRITRGANHLFGPIGILKNEGRYISADSDDKEYLNYVQLTFCQSPGKIKTIHRVILAKDQHEYYSIEMAYRKKFGMGGPFIHAGDEYEHWW